MKLKVYRISLLGALIASLAVDIFFLIQAISNIINVDQAEMMDGVMYIICLSLLAIFIGLEITNTVISFKTGSNYIKRLAFNDDNTPNRNLYYVLGGLSIFSLFAIIYFSLIYTGFNLPLKDFAKEIVSVIIAFFTTLFVDSIFILLFPVLAKEDPSLSN